MCHLLTSSAFTYGLDTVHCILLTLAWLCLSRLGYKLLVNFC